MGRAFGVLKRTAHLTVQVQTGGEGRAGWRRRGGAEKARSAACRAQPAVEEQGEGVTVHQRPSVRVRLSSTRRRECLWYTNRDYAKLLVNRAEAGAEEAPSRTRAFRKSRTSRAANRLKVDIYTSTPRHHHRPQGHRGRQAETGAPEARQSRGLHQHPGDPEAELNAQLISESVAMQLEKRVAFRRAMRKAVESALRFGRGASRCACPPAERRGNRALRVVSRGSSPCRSASRRHRLRLCGGEHDLRPDWHQGVAV